MTLTLTQDTEARLRTVAEEQGMDPAQLHEDLLRRALADVESGRQGLAPASRVLPSDAPLTHLPGRNAFHMQMDRQWKDSTRTGASFTLLLLDLDNFKQINDAVGHANSDLLIMEVAATLIQKTRPRDFVARYGGGEFAIILPDMNAAGAEHIVRVIRAEMIDYFSDKGQPVTLSIGIAEAPPFGESPNDLLVRADQALVAEKQGKRGDRERAFVPVLPEPEMEKTEAQKERIRRNARVIALLDSFAQGDPEQQRQDLEELQAGVEEARPGQRRVFGEGFNP